LIGKSAHDRVEPGGSARGDFSIANIVVDDSHFVLPSDNGQQPLP
jgi:hypothetical protein